MNGRALNADIIYYMFDAANMSRWNDHLRTLDLSELDKQAHKAVIAWVIGKSEEDAGRPVVCHQGFRPVRRRGKPRPLRLLDGCLR